ncbi:MAG: phage tail tape measure protein, partial [Algicola sp.]|nr:phage tail tape measure protein [Algicola sp.]
MSTRTTHLDKLMYRIGMTDKMSGGLNKLMRNINKFAQKSKAAFVTVAFGLAGLLTSVQALSGGIAPAMEVNKALGEIASLLDVEQRPKFLTSLTDMALKTSSQYGTSATEIIRASYDIQSAISGLSSNELSSFTRSSAILAMGTKADTATITDYMGTMYGIFKRNAAQVGKTQWVEQLTGKTAWAVQKFKPTGQRMSDAFVTLGADATAFKIPLAEQMATMGMLQAQMSGSEAGTKYKAFLAGVGKAQAKLNLTFVDSAGQMLPIPNILARITQKFGDISKVADSDLLMKAFGSKEAVSVVKLLGQDLNELKSNINGLGDVTGMKKAVGMAKTISDPWNRAGASIKAVNITMGRAFLPIVEPWVNALAEGAQKITRWASMFPNLTKAVAIFAAVLLSTVAVVSALTIAAGLAKFMMIGFSVVMATGTGIVTGYTWALAAMKAALIWTRGAMMAVIVTAALASGPFAAITAVTSLFTGSIWAMTTALLANPLFWIPAVIIGVG